jgi:hypothetical protein
MFVSLNRSARTRVYASKWTFLVDQLQMGKFWSILGTRTNLIAGKYSTFNGENDDVFGLWSKIYFLMIFDRLKILVREDAYMRVNGRIWCTNYGWVSFGQY